MFAAGMTLSPAPAFVDLPNLEMKNAEHGAAPVLLRKRIKRRKCRSALARAIMGDVCTVRRDEMDHPHCALMEFILGGHCSISIAGFAPALSGSTRNKYPHYRLGIFLVAAHDMKTRQAYVVAPREFTLEQESAPVSLNQPGLALRCWIG